MVDRFQKVASEQKYLVLVSANVKEHRIEEEGMYVERGNSCVAVVVCTDALKGEESIKEDALLLVDLLVQSYHT